MSVRAGPVQLAGIATADSMPRKFDAMTEVGVSGLAVGLWPHQSTSPRARLPAAQRAAIHQATVTYVSSASAPGAGSGCRLRASLCHLPRMPAISATPSGNCKVAARHRRGRGSGRCGSPPAPPLRHLPTSGQRWRAVASRSADTSGSTAQLHQDDRHFAVGQPAADCLRQPDDLPSGPSGLRRPSAGLPVAGTY